MDHLQDLDLDCNICLINKNFDCFIELESHPKSPESKNEWMKKNITIAESLGDQRTVECVKSFKVYLPSNYGLILKIKNTLWRLAIKVDKSSLIVSKKARDVYDALYAIDPELMGEGSSGATLLSVKVDPEIETIRKEPILSAIKKHPIPLYYFFQKDD